MDASIAAISITSRILLHMKKATYEQEDVAQYCWYNVLVTQKTQAASKANEAFSLNADNKKNIEFGARGWRSSSNVQN